MDKHAVQLLRDKMKGKYARVPAWIFHGSGFAALKGTELKILLLLYNEMNNYHYTAKISRDKIKEKTGASRGKISGILTDLVMQGYIRIEKQGRENIFHIQTEPPAAWPVHMAIKNKRRILKKSHRI